MYGYYQRLMKNDAEHDYVVLSKGFCPFETDNLNEAKQDATCKAEFSYHVTVMHIDGYPVVEYRNGAIVK